ncbi:hypothetical protein T484DRAFT_1822701 [Baffinella frigidus]|nr:hypothetical protein T484DRAFT_1822701 [Cryptophyta sp. CCMP2293]
MSLRVAYRESIHVPIRPPFLLVGHSVGSIYMRQFAMDYPHLTAAIVSLDGPSLTYPPIPP